MKRSVCALALAVSMLCSLVGCGSSKGSNATPVEEKERVHCIAETDYPLKELKVSGSEAMYEITTADLGLSDVLISMAVRVGNDLAVVYVGAKLSLIDPLNLKVKATLDMSSEIESFDQVLATELYVYDRDTKTQTTVCTELASKYTRRGLFNETKPVKPMA